jgi:hypothetical protein
MLAKSKRNLNQWLMNLRIQAADSTQQRITKGHECNQLHSPVYDERIPSALGTAMMIVNPMGSSYVLSPCILSSRECECNRAAPLILSPSEKSGDPAGGSLGETERCD